MFTRPPQLSDDDVVAAVQEGWGFDVQSVEYLPAGFGSHHWLVSALDRRRFATVDDLDTRLRLATDTLSDARRRLDAALATSAHLYDAGLDFVVAPLHTSGGGVVHGIGSQFALALFPFVGGQTYAYGNYPTDAARRAVVELLARLHSVDRTTCEAALTDDFAIPNRETLMQALDEIGSAWGSGPFAERARRLIATHAVAVERLIERYDDLTSTVSQRPDRFVVTHGEPHPANTITTDHGAVLIDWDTALIAPPERDLWGLIGEDPSISEPYSARTGATLIDDAIELYRVRWDLAEIAVYIAEFRRPHITTTDTSTSWTNLQHFLDPTRW